MRLTALLNATTPEIFQIESSPLIWRTCTRPDLPLFKCKYFSECNHQWHVIIKGNLIIVTFLTFQVFSLLSGFCNPGYQWLNKQLVSTSIVLLIPSHTQITSRSMTSQPTAVSHYPFNESRKRLFQTPATLSSAGIKKKQNWGLPP